MFIYCMFLLVLCIISLPSNETESPSQFGELCAYNCDFSSFIGDDPGKLDYIVYPANSENPSNVTPNGNQKIGVIDSGINIYHPQLQGKIGKTKSFTDDDPYDNLGHGTAVAISATVNTQSLVYSAKVTNEKNQVLLDATLKAIDWMVQEDVKLVNMSLGFDPDFKNAWIICEKLTEIATNTSCPLFIAAAGNRGKDKTLIPAACSSSNILSVSTTEDQSGKGDVIGLLPASVNRSTYLAIKSQEFIDSNKYLEAIPLLEELFNEHNDNIALGYRLAAIYFQENQTAKALEAITKVLTIAPDMEKALWLKALSAANLAKRELALTSLNKLISLNPDYPLANELHHFISQLTNELPHSLKYFFDIH